VTYDRWILHFYTTETSLPTSRTIKDNSRIDSTAAKTIFIALASRITAAKTLINALASDDNLKTSTRRDRSPLTAARSSPTRNAPATTLQRC
jgi:hypothetical protein